MKNFFQIVLFIIFFVGFGAFAQAGSDYERVDFQYLLSHSNEYDGCNVQICVKVVPYPRIAQVNFFEKKYFLHCPEEAIGLVNQLPIISAEQKLRPGKYILFGRWISDPEWAGMDVHKWSNEDIHKQQNSFGREAGLSMSLKEKR